MNCQMGLRAVKEISHLINVVPVSFYDKTPSILHRRVTLGDNHKAIDGNPSNAQSKEDHNDLEIEKGRV